MTDWVRGTGDRELLEYLDFQCPYCRAAHGAIKSVVLDDLAGRVRLRVRHFPIREKHPRAEATARAAEAAGRQGRFWEMHDLLFARFDAVTDEDLEAYASELGLDVARFAADVADPALAAAVEEDRQAGLAQGVTGTPGLFLDGERYTGFYDREALLDVLW
ncbi:MAG TPA: DsbA family protein [Baekduia sp.]|uniref:DsbA family protein n=1 Tax=Baekduia sp. TaxID=2600305 RepID=UPI002D781544|nr:DsbA family protein [Baekduia sp.]HET6510175.1 DsbA family protein [Baekduia sp.]